MMIRQFTLALSLLILPALLPAQHCPPHARAAQGSAIERLNQLPEELQPSEEQQAQLQYIRMEVAREVEQIQIAEEGDRDLIREIQQQGRERAQEVLTEEQLAFLNKQQEERQLAHQDRREQRQQLRAELKAYHEEFIQPAHIAIRGQLDAFISSEDQASLDQLRVIMNSRPQPNTDENRTLGQDREARREFHTVIRSWRQEHQADLEQLAALTEKYKEQIHLVLEQLEPKKEEWRAATKEIRDRYDIERGPDRRHSRQHRAGGHRPHRGHHGPPASAENDRPERNASPGKARRGGKGHLHATHFLLLEGATLKNLPVAPANNSELSLAPNPAASLTQLRYNLTTAGPVQISLYDDNGRLVHQLNQGHQEAGSQQIQLELHHLSTGKYQVVIESADQRLVEALVIGR